MKTMLIQCEGISPLLMSMMSEETLEGLRTGVRAPQRKDLPAETEAKEKIYRDPVTEQIGLPAEMLFSCLVNAGRNVKNGKKQISTAKDTTLPALLSLQETFLEFPDDCREWKVDRRRGQNKEGVALCVVRPRFNKWAFTVHVDFDEKLVSKDTVLALFENAGSSQGLGSFRPNKKGPFGRFKVARSEVIAK